MVHRMWKTVCVLIMLTVMLSPAYGESVSGSVYGTWDSSVQDTVKVVGNLSVEDGKTLIIKPGVVVSFLDNYRMVVKGHLEVQGEQGAPVIFEPAFHGEYWQGIQIDSSSSSLISMRWFTIRSAQYPINITASNVALNYGRIEDGLEAGIMAQNYSNVNINGCFVHVMIDDTPSSLAPLYVSLSNVDFSKSIIDYDIDLPEPAPNANMPGIYYQYSSGRIDSSHVEIESNNVATGIFASREDGLMQIETSSIHMRAAEEAFAVRMTRMNQILLDHLSIELEFLEQNPSYDLYGVYVEHLTNVEVYNTIVSNPNPANQVNAIPFVVDYDSREFSSIDVGYSVMHNVVDPQDVSVHIDEETVLRTDPLWTDDEYHLQEDSPCIDAGRPGAFDPDGTLPDIGKHYYNQLNVVDDDIAGTKLPATFEIGQVWPNPFNNAVQVSVRLPHPTPLSVSVYDITGRQVESLYRGVHASGELRLTWTPESHAAGTYFLRTVTPTHSESRKLVFLK
ncbi:T9SS type A sorting domain-containing protein [bacterium]|nr:T9SS type A sorting domain-containing protein [bacterium]